ncbi:chloroplastic group IIA intron splicing facilitator CRS1, chloroplastic isoform X2 [Telopea speciosissima]|uniref:chloroplastic group IIA intron splicing facilitator CRS1, chloroplastic isoform X2 n=1 Tax=Telopea speciosissima TaxID=54955 RepID=UPI001CC602C1|nr:chloroplastic group IIA intron splicing facilitator CRS1, chloroplastic isoform X2 [Telopea speciosissima]
MPTAIFLSASHTPHFFNCSNPSLSSTVTNITISTSSNTQCRNPPRNFNSNYPSKSLRVLPCEAKTPLTSNSSINNNSSDIQSPNPKFSILSETLSRANGPVKMPAAPWMKGPLLLPPSEVLDFSKSKEKSSSKGGVDEKSDSCLTEKVKGGRGRQAMRDIVRSITNLKAISDSEVPHNRPDDREFEFRVPLERVGGDGNFKLDGKMPWARGERIVIPRPKKDKVVTAAKSTLPPVLLKRLRIDAATTTKWVKVKKAGVTQAVVDEIKMIWRNNELAMLKFDIPLCLNMDRAREIVETKTRGLVVWCKKDILVVYRGCNHPSSSTAFQMVYSSFLSSEEISTLKITPGKSKDQMTTFQVRSVEIAKIESMTVKGRVLDSLPYSVEGNEAMQSISGTLYEREADRLLDGLGPRFIDWWRPKPLPIDADLLPEVVDNFKPPFRLSPPNEKPKLTDDELTYLRKLARPLPTHFALGRNKNLQGLAAAILKLWEKSLIAKIAVKWGVPNANNEEMAWELKRLTGGVLILRNKFFIIIYRGKDFLSCKVANLISCREAELRRFQLQEEDARQKAFESFYVTNDALSNGSTVGTFSEFQYIQKKCVHLDNGSGVLEVQIEAEKEKLKKELRKQERRLYILKSKIETSEKHLTKLNLAWKPSELVVDREMVTEEERQCFRKIGLKMNRYLVLGRRGVFDGVIGGLHQHWKHREIVKVVTLQRQLSQVMDTARLLEIESDGILVSVEKLRKGFAIILYRGKNYRRPLKLKPENLLTKRAALDRSLEMQRIGSLKFFAYQRQRMISDLKLKLVYIFLYCEVHEVDMGFVLRYPKDSPTSSKPN